MALLLETTLGDLVIDLDIEGSPELSKNILKLAKARYYTSTLVFNVQANRFCQLGDSQGDGSGGACIYGLISTLLESDDGKLHNQKVIQSQRRFLKSNMGRPLSQEECQEKGRVVATEMKGVADTIGSQLLITTSEGKDMALDGFAASSGTNNTNGEDRQLFRSVGVVREDENNVLDQIAAAYCDADGRPYADIRVIRALIVDDPFDDPPGMSKLLKERGVEIDEVDDRITASPEYERPPEETVEIRIQADQLDPLTGEDDVEKMREQEEQIQKREDKSRAVVLEMLGDLPDADITAPENVLFVCKLNPITEDDDLELIFSRFDEKVKAEIIRDQDTGSSLQYAFVEFSTKDQAVEAYFKMNNALVDDRRIKVDFSQSVAKVWNKFTQRMKNPSGNRANQQMPKDPFLDSKGQASRNNGRQAPRNFNQGRQDERHHRPQHFGANNAMRDLDHDRGQSGWHGDMHEGRIRGEEGLDAFGRAQRQPNRAPSNRAESPRRGDREGIHKRDNHNDERRSRRYEGHSGSREESMDDSRRRQKSHSSERRHRKRKHHKSHKSHHKRSRTSSSGDEERSRDTEKHRHRKRERHDDRMERSDPKDRSRSRRSRDRSNSPDRDGDRSRDRRRHDDRKKHHHDDDRDREHRRRSEHKERKTDRR